MVCFCLGMYSSFKLFLFFKYLLSVFYGFEVLRPKEATRGTLLAVQEPAIEQVQLNIILIGRKSFPYVECGENGKKHSLI